jgi:mono/diheme cytochrome c family protein
MKKVAILAALAFVAAIFVPAMAFADAAENWTKMCAKCHGKEGKGDTKVGKKLGIGDYTDPAWHEKNKDDAALVKAILEGKGEPKDGETPMPAFKDKLKEDDAKALVAHIRSFKKK